MKKITMLVGVFVLGMARLAVAGEMPEGWTPPKLSDGLTIMKSFDGQWIGTSTDRGQEQAATAQYHVTSAGTAVEEKLFAGTAHEMVSVYHDTAGKLSMTHYCALGNQPHLEVTESAPNRWTFKESPASASLLAGQMRMSTLVIEQPAKDTLVQTDRKSVV